MKIMTERQILGEMFSLDLGCYVNDVRGFLRIPCAEWDRAEIQALILGVIRESSEWLEVMFPGRKSRSVNILIERLFHGGERGSRMRHDMVSYDNDATRGISSEYYSE